MTQKPNSTHFYKKVPLEQIKAFCTLVETKDLSKTANICASSNATICLYISSLEKELGCELFVTKREYELTEKGKTHYEKAKIILKEVKEFYGSEEFDIKINKFDIYKFRLIKSIISLFKFIVRKFKVFVRMFLRVRYVVLVILFSILTVDLTLERTIKNSFQQKNKEVIVTIANDINNIDIMWSKLVQNSLNYVNSKMLINPNITKDDLINIKEQLNVTTISIFDENGYFYLTTGNAMNPNYELYNFYKQMSVLDLNYTNHKNEKGFSDGTRELFVKAKKNPNKPFVLPLFLSKPRNIPNKFGVLYDAKLKKLFDISYNENDIQDILNNNYILHKDIIYLGLLDNSGNIIAEKKSDEFEILNNLIYTNKSKYFKEIEIDRHHNYNLISIVVGDNKILQIKDQDKDYFYTLKIAFSKTELNKEIRQIRLILLAITTLSLLVVYTVWMVQKQPTGGRRKK